jgi:putative phosphoesterase
MQILVFSDLHSNSKNILDIINQERYDRLIFAGDIFGYFPFDKEILDFIKKQNIDFILGNHDIYFLKELYPELFYKRFTELNKCMLSSNVYDSKYGILMETLKTQPKLDLKIFDKANLCKRVLLDGIDILICHGSPRNPFNEYIYPDYEYFDLIYEEYVFDILILGHTHKQFVNEKNGRFIINPGSCALPRGSCKPSYAIVETNPIKIIILELDQQIGFRKISSNKVELTDQVKSF